MKAMLVIVLVVAFFIYSFILPLPYSPDFQYKKFRCTTCVLFECKPRSAPKFATHREQVQWTSSDRKPIKGSSGMDKLSGSSSVALFSNGLPNGKLLWLVSFAVNAPSRLSSPDFYLAIFRQVSGLLRFLIRELKLKFEILNLRFERCFFRLKDSKLWSPKWKEFNLIRKFSSIL